MLFAVFATQLPLSQYIPGEMAHGVLQGRTGQLGLLLSAPASRRPVPSRTACRCSSQPGGDDMHMDRRALLAALFTVGLAGPAQAAKPAPTPAKKDAYKVWAADLRGGR